MEPEACEKRGRRAIVRALESPPTQVGESDHDQQREAPEPSSPAAAECMLTLAEELGRMAADLYADGKI
jgi:hypothetical protein